MFDPYKVDRIIVYTMLSISSLVVSFVILDLLFFKTL